ncbi:MAG: outer membrane protein transport protein [Campylobacterota bacterium]|nr:outer membrane protein transport protein [Campylobacterota bacterium]
MKTTYKILLGTTLALSLTPLFATNGSNLIGTSVESRAMGGAAIAFGHGATSASSNAALITSLEDTQFSISGTLFMPEVTFDNGMGAGAKKSDANMSVIPSFSLATQQTDKFYWGVGFWATAGMGVDYKDQASNFNMFTNLQLMQLALPLAYKVDNLSLSFTPILQYGSLGINYNNGVASVGMGESHDFQLGFNLGAAYRISDFTLGLMYKSKIDMKYKDQLSVAMQGFGVNYTNDELSTPEEFGLGISYVLDNHTIAIDYKQIKWSKAKGYKDFAWSDQNVVAVGYEYAVDKWALRAGYNHASNPISDQGLAGTLVNTMNLLGFPAVVETHMSVGGRYAINEKTSIDLAYVHVPKKTLSYKISNAPFPGERNITTTHGQSSFSMQLNHKFRF